MIIPLIQQGEEQTTLCNSIMKIDMVARIARFLVYLGDDQTISSTLITPSELASSTPFSDN